MAKAIQTYKFLFFRTLECRKKADIWGSTVFKYGHKVAE
jgi:hypothetical protein